MRGRVKAGRLNRQISIYRPVVTQDATSGADVVTWEPLVAQAGSPVVAERFWAEVVDALPSRSEAVRQGVVQATQVTYISIRHRSDVTSDMRITVHGDSDVDYQIVSGPAASTQRKGWIEMGCQHYSTAGNAA